MATAQTRQQFPNLGAPLVTDTGLLTQEWRQFFSTLWARTGSAVGGLDIKIGTMLPYGGASVPEGYLLCDGSEVLRASYPNLFTAIGTVWGNGNGTTTFNLPDARGKSLIGKSGAFALGSTGGVNEVTLTEENIPEHTHVLVDPGHTHGATSGAHTHTVTDPGHTHAVTDPGHVHTSLVANALGTAGTDPNSVAGNTGNAVTGISLANATTGITLGSGSGTTTIDSAVTDITMEPVGSGDEFSIQNPYIAVNWIIKS